MKSFGKSQLTQNGDDFNNDIFSWTSILDLVQRSHYKSGNLHKLVAAVKIYTGLAMNDFVRREVLAKLCSMLCHPFPLVSPINLSMLLGILIAELYCRFEIWLPKVYSRSQTFLNSKQSDFQINQQLSRRRLGLFGRDSKSRIHENPF